MNPIQEEPNTTPTGGTQPQYNPSTFVPENSSPQADVAALEAIGALEAEEDTSRFTQPIQPTTEPLQPSQFAQPISTAQSAQPVEPVQPTEALIEPMTPFVSEQPTVTPQDVPLTAAVPASPLQTNSDPFVKQKKSSKKLVIILIAAIVVIGVAVAGYFVWQSTQTTGATETTDSTNGNQPSGTIPTPTDTESSVNSSATSLEEGANSINDSGYADTALSDETLYEN